MRLSVLVAAAFSLIACAGTQSKSSAANANGKTQTQLASSAGNPAPKGTYSCTYEEVPGSHIREKVCRYDDADRQSHDRSQNELMNPHGGSNMPQVNGH
jgi:hypothetical protein